MSLERRLGKLVSERARVVGVAGDFASIISELTKEFDKDGGDCKDRSIDTSLTLLVAVPLRGILSGSSSTTGADGVGSAAGSGKFLKAVRNK